MSRRFKHDTRTDADVVAVISTSSSGPPKWRQSPVDLRTIDTWTQKFPPLLLTGYWLKKGRGKITNTGKTVNIELTQQTTYPYLRGGPLKDVFRFKNVQFRWGPTNSRGAEHTIDSIWYSMEAQALHWNTRYGSIERCYDKPDGIAILSYLMQVVGCKGMPDNPIISRVTNHLARIKKMGSSVEVTPDCLWWMLHACTVPGYFTYPGSLTVPPYNECVIWMIISNSIKISAGQMDTFRSIYDYKWDPIMALLPDYYKGVIGLAKSGQSPIDIDESIARPKRFPSLILNGHWMNEGEAILGNDGNVATVVLGGQRIPSTVSGGPLLNDVYEFFICNFRWAEENCNGSEHTINGTWYSMEAQMVHWNRKYASFDNCLNHKDGLCILSCFFLVPGGPCPENNPQVDKITEHLKYVVDAGSEINVPPNALCWMRWATRCERYFSYQGSYNEGTYGPLGYPECVTWIIFPLIIPIGPSQIDAFRMLKDEEGNPIRNNCDKIQLLRGRRIFVCIS